MNQQKYPKLFIIISAISGGLILSLLVLNTFFTIEIRQRQNNSKKITQVISKNVAFQKSAANYWEQKLFPSAGTELPITWNDLGQQLIKNGVIDQDKFEKIYAARGGLDEAEKRLLAGSSNEKIVITKNNSGFLLNLFWALGLSNKNDILESGPMRDPRYGGAGNFASTGGWTIAKGDVMNHYGAHAFLKLTDSEQELVKKVSSTIYRPCCNNSTYFPDCNHGMAILGFLELMASQGANEDTMYRAAAQLNSYWFPSTYLTIAKYLEKNGATWDSTDPRVILSAQYSSSSGYNRILAEIEPVAATGGGACGV